MAIPLTLAQKIINAACTYYGCTFDELKSKTKTDERKIVVYLQRKEAMMKLARIQEVWDYKGHGWLFTIVEDIDSLRTKYKHISDDIKNIMEIVATL